MAHQPTDQQPLLPFRMKPFALQQKEVVIMKSMKEKWVFYPLTAVATNLNTQMAFSAKRYSCS